MGRQGWGGPREASKEAAQESRRKVMAWTRAAVGGGGSGEIPRLLCGVDRGAEPQVVRGLGLSMWRVEAGFRERVKSLGLLVLVLLERGARG